MNFTLLQTLKYFDIFSTSFSEHDILIKNFQLKFNNLKSLGETVQREINILQTIIINNKSINKYETLKKINTIDNNLNNYCYIIIPFP